MGKYDAQINLAYDLIDRAGRSLTYYRKTSTFDPITGAETGVDEVQGKIKGVVLPASKGTIEAFDNRVTADIVPANIRYLICAAKNATFVPQDQDEFQLDEYRWRVMGVTPLAPDGTPIIFKLGVQRL